jgi:hypothetical protein
MKAMYRRKEMCERRRDLFLASGRIAISVRLNWGCFGGWRNSNVSKEGAVGRFAARI